MGSPKALLGYRGETFLGRLMRLFAERCDPVVVVLGGHSAEISRAIPEPPRVRYVLNHDWRNGQTTSFLRGLREIPARADGVLFSLVDHPAVEPATIEALLQAGGRLRIPRYNGQRGHPIWFSREFLPEFDALPPDGAARDVIRAHYSEASWIDTPDAGILADIDDPAAYRTLTGVEA